MHIAGDVPWFQERGHRAGREKPCLGSNNQLVAVSVAAVEKFRQGCADGSLRALVPVVDGGVEKIDATADGRNDGFPVGMVGLLIGVAEVRSQPHARKLQVAEWSVEGASGDEPGGEADRS